MQFKKKDRKQSKFCSQFTIYNLMLINYNHCINGPVQVGGGNRRRKWGCFKNLKWLILIFFVILIIMGSETSI